MRRGTSAGIGGAPAPQLTGIPAGLKQTIAVSDATNREPHPFARDWSSPSEQAEILAKIQALAQPAAPHLSPHQRPRPRTAAPNQPEPSPTPASPHPIHAGPPATHAHHPLTSEELKSYTLSYGGLPTFVYTAVNEPVASAPTQPDRYIALVAQQLPSGELQLAFSSVTDADHLDRTPWFRFIDVVDPDASHRASLLFELRGHTTRQFALYSILSAHATEQFLTNPTY